MSDSSKTSVKRPIDAALSPFLKFMALEASSGITLLFASAAALFLANSNFYDWYRSITTFNAGFMIAGHAVVKTADHWVNDGLMAVFFYVVGLEIKREILIGELSTLKKAALPIFAALGGMIVPALLYTALNAGTPYQNGWGIPMATDIAFAVGVLVLLGKRIPTSLKIFLLALAIADDLGAVTVIALFYTDQIFGNALAMAAFLTLLILIFRRVGVRAPIVYLVLSILTWFAVLKSGVHATVAGVVLGFLTPYHLDDGTSPLENMEHLLKNWVSFVIMPIFAFFNAGVRVEGLTPTEVARHPVSLGIILGLILGKPLGIAGFAWVSRRLGLAVWPKDFNLKLVIGAGFLGGIGFTMAIFISNLSLKNLNVDVYSKVGILVASAIAAALGFGILSLATKKR